MFKKACFRDKEHFSLLILGSLATKGFFSLAELLTQTKKSPDFITKNLGLIFGENPL
jgi:hypothetical protein